MLNSLEDIWWLRAEVKILNYWVSYIYIDVICVVIITEEMKDNYQYTAASFQYFILNNQT